MASTNPPEPPATQASSTPQPVPRVVQNLQTLPVEVIHSILDDLPLSRVLFLTIPNIPYINACILSHIHYQHLFRTPSDLDLLRSYYTLYATIRLHLSLTRNPTGCILSSHPSLTPLHLSDLRHHLHTSIVNHINSLISTPSHLTALSTVSSIPLTLVWNSSTLDNILSYWTDLNTAVAALAVYKKAQLEKLRSLLTTHPQYLKRGPDPSQEPRKNVAHLEAYLTRGMKRAEPRREGPGWRVTGMYPHGLPLVPYDRYLRLFLKVLERYPLGDEDMPGITLPLVKLRRGGFVGRRVGVKGEGKDVVALEGNGGEKVKQKVVHAPRLKGAEVKTVHKYTPEAVRYIQKAILGLKYVYLTTPSNSDQDDTDGDEGDKKERVIRTRYTPYSAHPYNFSSGYAQPCFVLPERRERCIMLMAAEIEWLDAFLWSCRYMEGMEGPWDGEGCVSDMWRAKEV